MLDIVYALAERLAHVGNRPRKQTDLIAAGGKSRHVHFARPAEANTMRCDRQPPKWSSNSPGKEEREQDRNQDCESHRNEQRTPLAADDASEVAVVRREQEDFSPHRRCSRENRCQVGSIACFASCLAG